MQNSGTKPTRQSFRDSEEFQQFRTLLQTGFVKTDATLPAPELLAFTEPLAQVLQRSDRGEAETDAYFRRIFQHIKGLQHVQDPIAIAVELRMLKARLAYADGRQIISRNFHLIMETSLDSILASEQILAQLPGLCGFLEALYGYYYYHTQRDVRKRRS